MNRINQAFINKNTVIGFLTAGDPSVEKTCEYVLTLEKAGVSLILLGIPFSDSVGEGPIIQEANIRALKNGMSITKVFEIIKEIRKTSNLPICLMTYLNPVFRYGYDKFFKVCQDIGVDGMIIPDCPFEESQEVSNICNQYGINLISILTKASKQRIKELASKAEGFIYYLAREKEENELQETVTMIKSITNVPVAIEFENNQQLADGIIIRNELVNIIKENGFNAKEVIFDYIQLLTCK